MDNSTVNNTSTPESAPAKEPWVTPVLLYLSRGDDAVNKPPTTAEFTTNNFSAGPGPS
jgi:hypothetical protein